MRRRMTFDDLRLMCGWQLGDRGERIADLWQALNSHVYAGKLRPAPITFPKALPYGHCLGQTICGKPDAHEAIDIKVGMSDDETAAVLLHEMLHQHLSQERRVFRHNSKDWCIEVMRITKLVWGVDMWAAPVKIAKEAVGRDEEGRQIRKSVRQQAASPDGQPSPSMDDIKRWPYSFGLIVPWQDMLGGSWKPTASTPKAVDKKKTAESKPVDTPVELKAIYKPQDLKSPKYLPAAQQRLPAVRDVCMKHITKDGKLACKDLFHAFRAACNDHHLREAAAWEALQSTDGKPTSRSESAAARGWLQGKSVNQHELDCLCFRSVRLHLAAFVDEVRNGKHPDLRFEDDSGEPVLVQVDATAKPAKKKPARKASTPKPVDKQLKPKPVGKRLEKKMNSMADLATIEIERLIRKGARDWGKPDHRVSRLEVIQHMVFKLNHEEKAWAAQYGLSSTDEQIRSWGQGWLDGKDIGEAGWIHLVEHYVGGLLDRLHDHIKAGWKPPVTTDGEKFWLT